MYSNSEYSSLLAQLNRANAEIMNLKDQVRYYREHKEEREAEIKKLIKEEMLPDMSWAGYNE